MDTKTMIPDGYRINNKGYVAEVCAVSVKVVRGVQCAAKLNGCKFAELRMKELRGLREIARQGLYDFTVNEGVVLFYDYTASEDVQRVVSYVTRKNLCRPETSS